jgi:hypothetical protein
MDTQQQPSDRTFHLPRDVYRQLVHKLRGYLPPPVDDTPEALAQRDNAAIAHVASMLPANADEADIAARCVGLGEYAKDCLLQARERRGDLSDYLKCTAQAASMERQAHGARSLLQRVQAERRKREADSRATDAAAWTEHCALGLMTDALDDAAPAAAADPPPPAEEPVVDLLAEAELYANIYPRRAALIRSLGGLPDPRDFGPPPPELVHVIVTGTTPTLLALDTEATP